MTLLPFSFSKYPTGVAMLRSNIARGCETPAADRPAGRSAC